jgi:hypothetical protein
MPLTTPGLDMPGGTEYRRTTRNDVDRAARGTRRGLDCSPLQMTQDVSECRLLRASYKEPERASSAPGTDPMPSALRVFLPAL